MEQQRAPSLPRHADIVVLGGGTSGCVVAGRLAERSDRSVLLLEAGPDFGPYAAGGWPAQLLDSRSIPWKLHDWNYISAARHGRPELRLDRGRVLGGCSAHNGCHAIWGARDDYDGWERLGNRDWGTRDVLPYFQSAMAQMRVRKALYDELSPFQQATMEGAPGAGIPVTDDLNDLDQHVAMGASPVNIWQGVRWNAAFAYLDPVRERGNLAVCGDVMADRVVVHGGRATAVEVIGREGPARIEAGVIVLSGGAYGSPAVLLRSGIGPADDLRALGIAPVHDLPGVGANLHDQPAFMVTYAGTPGLEEAMRAYVDRGGLLREEQTIVKARSTLCRTAFDLHVTPIGSPYWSGDGRWLYMMEVANVFPLSRGTLRLAGRDANLAPIIDHGYLTDPEDIDLTILLEAVELGRALAAQPPLAGLIGAETWPGSRVRGEELRGFVRANCEHYYHPVGTCAMGPSGDPRAVVDAAGRVHGMEGLFVADASIMPVTPRANTNIPSAMIGEKVAAGLLAGQ
jgi:choline dehydrogenase